jgi:hypothetical protein
MLVEVFTQNLSVVHTNQVVSRKAGDIAIALIDQNILMLVIKQCKKERTIRRNFCKPVLYILRGHVRKHQDTTNRPERVLFIELVTLTRDINYNFDSCY